MKYVCVYMCVSNYSALVPRKWKTYARSVWFIYIYEIYTPRRQFENSEISCGIIMLVTRDRLALLSWNARIIFAL